MDNYLLAEQHKTISCPHGIKRLTDKRHNKSIEIAEIYVYTILHCAYSVYSVWRNQQVYAFN